MHRMALGNLASGSKSNNNNSLTWSQGQMIPPKHIKRYPMATRHTQTTSENIRSSFLKTGSTQTRINIAKKIARAVGTVIKNATWSSISWKQRKIKGSQKLMYLKVRQGQDTLNWLHNELSERHDNMNQISRDMNQNRIYFTVRSSNLKY